RHESLPITTSIGGKNRADHWSQRRGEIINAVRTAPNGDKIAQVDRPDAPEVARCADRRLLWTRYDDAGGLVDPEPRRSRRGLDVSANSHRTERRTALATATGGGDSYRATPPAPGQAKADHHHLRRIYHGARSCQ